MTIHEEILAAVSKRLVDVNPNTPWMTARSLAASIGRSEQEVRQVLSDYSRSAGYGEHPIRYSRFPSKRNLDLLWGHTEKVGSLSHYEPLDKTDQEHEGADIVADGSWLFLSHSHHDTDRALEIRATLRALGINAWLAETNILRGQAIVDSIRLAFDTCDVLLLDVTLSSIGSLWVQKEFLTFRGTLLVLVDGGSDELIDLFERDLENPPDRPHVDPNELNPPSVVYPEFIQEVKARLSCETTPCFAYPPTSRTLCGKTLHEVSDVAAFVERHER